MHTYSFYTIHLRKFYDIFDEYRIGNGTLYWGKPCNATFGCHDLDTTDGLTVLNGTTVIVNAMYSI